MANAADRSQVERANARAKRIRKQEQADLRAVMDTPEGRRVIWRFLERAAPFGSAFNTNAMAQSHTIGWQDAGKWWLSEIDDTCPEKYLVMVNEARRAAKQDALRDEIEATEDDDHG